MASATMLWCVRGTTHATGAAKGDDDDGDGGGDDNSDGDGGGDEEMPFLSLKSTVSKGLPARIARCM